MDLGPESGFPRGGGEGPGLLSGSAPGGPDPALGHQNKACGGGCAGQTPGPQVHRRWRHGEHSDELGGTTRWQQKVTLAILEAELGTQVWAGRLPSRPHPLAGPGSSRGVLLWSVS